MATVSGSFTAIGVSSVLDVAKDETITFSVSGTFDQTVQLERAVTPDETMWEIVKGPYEAAASDSFQVNKAEKLRWRSVRQGGTPGTATYSVADGNRVVKEIKDRYGNIVLTIDEDTGLVLPNGLQAAGDLDVTGNAEVDGVLTIDTAPIFDGAAPVFTAVASGVSVANFGNGAFSKTTLTLTDVEMDIADADAFGSVALATSPTGRTHYFGAVFSGTFAVSTDRATTINDDADFDWSLGWAATADTTLSSTEATFIAKQDLTLAAAGTGTNSDSAAFTSGQGAAFGTQITIYLNGAIPTTTEIDGDGTIVINGSVDFYYIYMPF